MQFSILALTAATLAAVTNASPVGKYFGLIVIRPSTEFQNQGVTFNSATNKIQIAGSGAEYLTGFLRPDGQIALPEGKFIDVKDSELYAHGGGATFGFTDSDLLTYQGQTGFVLRKNEDGEGSRDIFVYNENDQKDGDLVVTLRAVN